MGIIRQFTVKTKAVDCFLLSCDYKFVIRKRQIKDVFLPKGIWCIISDDLSKEQIFEKLDECYEEIQNFERDLKNKLSLDESAKA